MENHQVIRRNHSPSVFDEIERSVRGTGDRNQIGRVHLGADGRTDGRTATDNIPVVICLCRRTAADVQMLGVNGGLDRGQTPWADGRTVWDSGQVG